MDEPKPHIYEFGDFRLDASKRLLLRSGEPVPLTPKVFDTLLYLVEHRGAVLSKDELMTAVWPDTVVEENNLGQNISKLRGVLGESRGENRYIVTLPGRGYRFVADVKRAADYPSEREPEGRVALRPGDGTRGATASASPRSSRRVSRRKNSFSVALLAGTIAVGLCVAGVYLWRGRTRPASGQPVRAIAVLPFKPLVVGNRDEALEMGMADTLISKLSGISELTVRPLSRVRRYGGPEQDPFAAGRELGVEAVLDGHVQRWGDRVRVTARLVRVGDGKQLWAGHFDEEFTNIFSVQDSISEKVTRELALELTGEEERRLAKRHTADAEAYELYLKGRFFISLAQPRRAIELFERAVRRDPDFALAHAGLADIYSRLPIAADAPSREAIPRAKKAALKALEIDDRLAEAYAALGWIDFYYEWDWEGSEANHRRALEINPDDFSARLGYAHLLSNTGRHEEALREVDQSIKLDSLSPIANALKGQFLFHARRHSEAIEQLHKTLEVNPAFWVALVQLGRSYEQVGRHPEALEAFRKARESGGATAPLSLIGYTQGASGHKEEAERTLRELRSLSEETYVPPYNVALVYHGLGNTAEAVRWLERAYDERDVRMVFIGVDPLWDSLRGEPRFTGLLERMKLPK
jgi:DNA-binding winged helix-turn-helix (wHTH) protein/TolB-like protein/thioredoxin-like negative regulator of GroEL